MSAPESVAIPALQRLQSAGAAQWSPVNFHFLQALALRVPAQPGPVRQLLEARLAQAIADYERQFKPVTAPLAGEASANKAATWPVKADSSPLGALLRDLALAGAPVVGAAVTSDQPLVAHPRGELKSVQKHRETWSKLRAQRQVAQALEQAPKNAGPINSHMLVLRSLELMRTTSQDYLNRFMCYADTLLCLEETDLSAKAQPRKTTVASRLKRTPRG